jgi:hypothetical protein
VTRIGEPLRTTVALSSAAALTAVAGGALLGQWWAGLAVAAGLLIGASNGFLARGALHSEIDFRLTSGLRLLLLTGAALGVAALLDIRLAPFVIGGVAVAQLLLAVVAAVKVARA